MLDKLTGIQQFLAFLTRNVLALVLCFLIASLVGLVYQYKEIIRLNESIHTMGKESLQYERERSAKLESLLNNLSNRNNNDSSNR